MGVIVFFVLCSLVGSCVFAAVRLENDEPFVRVLLSDTVNLTCCYSGDEEEISWVKWISNSTLTHTLNKSVRFTNSAKRCGNLTFENVQLNDTGLYRCWLNSSKVFTHGTYLQVYKLMEKMINLNESTKNAILTIEGVLLLLCVLVPSATILFKSKGLRELEMKKAKAEEENIYQGLNLDECCTTYDQIERSQVQGQYQDICNGMEEREEIQLEKP